MILELHKCLATDRIDLIFPSSKGNIAIPFDYLAFIARARLSKKEMIELRDAINEQMEFS